MASRAVRSRGDPAAAGAAAARLDVLIRIATAMWLPFCGLRNDPGKVSLTKSAQGRSVAREVSRSFGGVGTASSLDAGCPCWTISQVQP